MIAVVVSMTALSAPALTGPTASAVTVARVMPLGDSNTSGWPNEGSSPSGPGGGYRVRLEQRLDDANRAFDFVGQYENGPPELQRRRHQGVDGLTIGEIQMRFTEQWYAQYPADVVLLMAGTNNLKPSIAQSVDVAEAEMRALLEHIGGVAPAAHVIVSTIPPQRDPSADLRVDDFNDRLPDIVSDLAGAGQKVSLVDANAVLARGDLIVGDNLHLNPGGYATVGDVFYNGLVPVLNSMVPPPTTVPPTTVPPTTVPPTTDDGLFMPLGPSRLMDTRVTGQTFDGLFAGGGPRGAGSISVVQVTGRAGAPAGAAAAAVNLTVLDAGAAGYATLYPCGSLPDASTINFVAGPSAIANGVVVPLNAAGELCVFVYSSANVLIDLAGTMP